MCVIKSARSLATYKTCLSKKVLTQYFFFDVKLICLKLNRHKNKRITQAWKLRNSFILCALKLARSIAIYSLHRNIHKLINQEKFKVLWNHLLIFEKLNRLQNKRITHAVVEVLKHGYCETLVHVDPVFKEQSNKVHAIILQRFLHGLLHGSRWPLLTLK